MAWQDLIGMKHHTMNGIAGAILGTFSSLAFGWIPGMWLVVNPIFVAVFVQYELPFEEDGLAWKSDNSTQKRTTVANPQTERSNTTSARAEDNTHEATKVAESPNSVPDGGRKHSDAQSEQQGVGKPHSEIQDPRHTLREPDPQGGETFRNAGIGVVVSTVSYFIPVLNLIAPIFGGFVAGYLQKRGSTGGMKVGALKGILTIVPAIFLAMIASGIISQIPIIGAVAAGSMGILIIVFGLHAILLGWFGGLFGGLFAGNYAKK